LKFRGNLGNLIRW